MRGAVRCRTRLPHGGVSPFRGIGPHRNGPQTARAMDWIAERTIAAGSSGGFIGHLG